MNVSIQQLIASENDKVLECIDLGIGNSILIDLPRIALQYQAMLKELEGDLPRSRVVGTGPHRDVWLLRFLIGFNWDVKLAAEKFRNMLAFRETHGVDAIRQK